MAGYVQIVEVKTDRIDEVRAAFEQWLAETEGKRTATRATMGRDPNRDGYHLFVMEFPSHDAAQRNNDLPETAASAERLQALCEKVSFYDIADVEFREI